MDFDTRDVGRTVDGARSDMEARAAAMRRKGITDDVIKAYFAEADRIGLENMPSMAEFLGMYRPLN